MKPAIVIPWRSTGPDREVALERTKKALSSILPDAPIFLSDDGSEIFNRSGSRNKGVKEAKDAGYDTVVVCDADTIPQKRPVLEALEACYKDGRLHLPYTKCYLLAKNNSVRLETTHSVGGVWVMRIDAWERIGGQYEGFTGWGYEDDAFNLAACTILGETVRHEGLIKCQWHEEEWVWGSEPYQANRRLYHLMKALSRDPELLDRFLHGEDVGVLPLEKQKKIAAFAHYSAPKKNAGSEVMLHEMLVALRKRGHHVRLYATENPNPNYREPHEHDGIEIFEAKRVDAVNLILEWNPDVIIAHHKNIDYIHRPARKAGIPWVMVAHNDRAYTAAHIKNNPDLIAVNTRWIPNKHEALYRGRNHIVVHPPVYAEVHRTNRGDCITLVNTSKFKGAEIFYWLAEKLPEMKFLAVEGAYEDQIFKKLPNVEFVKHTSNMSRDVWSRTKLLIMPSEYESYGMVGVEAMASGIPVVATPTPGLIESLSFAGTFVERDDKEGWLNVVRSLMTDEELYSHASAMASYRSAQINPDEELRNWVEAVEQVIR